MQQDPEYFFTIEKMSTAEFKDRGSRFIAYAHPLGSKEQFKVILQLSKKEHPKAAHHCFAYRIGWEGLEFRTSDDGEPAGSAGRPIMGQLESRQLVDTAVIVVRYFGGTLLGVPGLINAYKSATAMALQTVPIIRKPIEVEYRLDFDYTLMNEVMRILKQFQCRIIHQELQLFCTMLVGIPKGNLSLVLSRIGEIQGISSKKGEG